jgi:hypothetical protein
MILGTPLVSEWSATGSGRSAGGEVFDAMESKRGTGLGVNGRPVGKKREVFSQIDCE